VLRIPGVDALIGRAKLRLSRGARFQLVNFPRQAGSVPHVAEPRTPMNCRIAIIDILVALLLLAYNAVNRNVILSAPGKGLPYSERSKIHALSRCPRH